MAGVKGRSGGRNRKSTQLHIIAGTFRQDRHGDGETPEPPKGDPKPPLPLAGEAKAEWDRMVERLKASHTLATVDDGALYQYVQLHAETEGIKADTNRARKDLAAARKLSATLKRTAQKLEGAELIDAIDKIVQVQDKVVRLHLLIAKETQQLRMGHMALRIYLVEFGMTPAARSRVKVPAGREKPKSAVEQWKMGG